MTCWARHDYNHVRLASKGRTYVLPLPLQTVQLPVPLHLEQLYVVNMRSDFPVPLHFEHLPVPSQPLHSAIQRTSFMLGPLSK